MHLLMRSLDVNSLLLQHDYILACFYLASENKRKLEFKIYVLFFYGEKFLSEDRNLYALTYVTFERFVYAYKQTHYLSL